MTKVVRVHILDVPYHADREYDYYAPTELEDEILEGSLVVVPFGTANRQKVALVTSFGEDAEYETNKIKHIVSVLNPCLALTKEMLGLCRFMKSTTLCTLGEACKCMVPSVMVSQVNELLYCTDKPMTNSEYAELYNEVSKKPGITVKKLKERYPSSEEALKWLLRNRYIVKRTEITEKDKNKYETVYSLAISKDNAINIINGKIKPKLRSERQLAILSLLCEYAELSDKEIYQRADCTRQQLDALVSKELVRKDKRPLKRDSYDISVTEKTENLILSKEQTEAYKKIEELYSSGEAKAALLHGVTGSGKTSVMKKLIDRVISDGRGVIILVPEISLTPQTVSTFCGYYGDRVAVIHSALSAGERFDAYNRIKNGDCNIVIGTRSAVFAPLSNLGMIIIDEEQEHTYKSDTSPKYLAHDIARYRCAESKALMLLASATPSLTSYYKAESGIYTLVKLTKRYGNATLPDVIITDMHRERAAGNTGAFGTKLATLLSEVKEQDRQAILFLNRRGYHSAVSCGDCGKVIECPNCSIAMTYHSFKKINEDINADNAGEIMSGSGILRCHYCGYQSRLPKVCPSCKNEHFEYVGIGTQKLENDLSILFPDITSIRMDADTTTQKSSYENIISSFLYKKADVLIGTQMVTKGHNFPKVTLVGVMLADMMLYVSDYRAAERTFSMLTQVIGRAGRAKDKGVAVIQTNSPSDRTIQYAATQNYEEFYKNEIQVRKAYIFPPFCDIALISVSSADERELERISDNILSRLKREFTEISAPVVAYGPFEAPIYRSKGTYRKRIIVKCKLNSGVRAAFGRVYDDFTREQSRTRVSVDFNPTNL